MIAVKCASTNAPEVVDRNPNVHLTDSEFYSGCWARASIYAHPYDMPIKKGVTLILKNVQKLRDDDSLGGSRSSAASDFDDDMSEKGEAASDFDDGLGLD